MTTFRTRQELFDNAVRGIFGQGRIAFDGMCLYRQSRRADSPVRCAVGWNIPDEEYRSDMEDGYSAGNGYIADAAGIKKEDREFAEHLQRSHDLLEVTQRELGDRPAMYAFYTTARLIAVIYELGTTELEHAWFQYKSRDRRAETRQEEVE